MGKAAAREAFLVGDAGSSRGAGAVVRLRGRPSTWTKLPAGGEGGARFGFKGRRSAPAGGAAGRSQLGARPVGGRRANKVRKLCVRSSEGDGLSEGAGRQHSPRKSAQAADSCVEPKGGAMPWEI